MVYVLRSSTKECTMPVLRLLNFPFRLLKRHFSSIKYLRVECQIIVPNEDVLTNSSNIFSPRKMLQNARTTKTHTHTHTQDTWLGILNCSPCCKTYYDRIWPLLYFTACCCFTVHLAVLLISCESRRNRLNRKKADSQAKEQQRERERWGEMEEKVSAVTFDKSIFKRFYFWPQIFSPLDFLVRKCDCLTFGAIPRFNGNICICSNAFFLSPPILQCITFSPISYGKSASWRWRWYSHQSFISKWEKSPIIESVRPACLVSLSRQIDILSRRD